MYYHNSGIVIKKLSRDHLPTLLKLKEESWWGTHTTSFINQTDQEKWFENLPSNHFVAIGLKDDKIASVSILSEIDWIARTTSISGSVTLEFRSKEIVEACCAAEIDFAFEMFNLHRLNAEVIEYNVPAQQYEIGYLGFAVEGVKRQSVYKCGQYYNSIVLGLLREDWQNQPRVLGYKGSCNKTFNKDLVEKLIVRSKYITGRTN